MCSQFRISLSSINPRTMLNVKRCTLIQIRLFLSLQPLLCQIFYTLIEYGKTAMFLWMFIEGLILHHMTTVAYSRGPDDQKKFYFSGWRKSIAKRTLY